MKLHRSIYQAFNISIKKTFNTEIDRKQIYYPRE